jgi:hypothetical protein
MLQWFDDNPSWYWWLVCAALIASFAVMLRPLVRADWKDVNRTDWRWGWVILGLLVVGRWPTWFVTREFNTDESQLIAGVITLRHDPMFWRSVDGVTAGPLDFYALMPAGWIHGADDYFSVRLTALLLVAAALVFAHQAVALAFGRQVARTTGFAVVCFESLTLHVDILHYSTELVPVTLLAAAVFLCVRRFLEEADWRWNAVGGLMLGAVPLAKLQAVPIAGLLGLGWVAGELWLWRQRSLDWKRRLAALCAGAAAPILACALALFLTGQWQHALIPYFLHNISYVEAAQWHFKEVVATIADSSFPDDGLLLCWLAGAGSWLLLTLPLSRATDRSSRLLAAGAVGLCLTSLVCIFVPGRPFPHYLQLLVVPLILVLGATTGLVVNALENHRSIYRRGLLGAAVLCTTGGLLFVRGTYKHPYVGILTMYQAHPQGTIARELRKYAQPGEALGVWGYLNSAYAEAGLRQATRDTHSASAIVDNPQRPYFRRRYLADLERSAPPVFVDAVGPRNIAFENRALIAHETNFPELGAYIRAHYTQVADEKGCRVYVRNDRLPAAPH